jgi:hypothetical protein
MRLFTLALLLGFLGLPLGSSSFAFSGEELQENYSSIRDPLITVTSEFFPGESYTLGILSDGNGILTGIYYQDPHNSDSQMHDRVFRTELLRTPQVLIRAKGYDVIKIGLTGNHFTVYYKRDVRESRWSSKTFDLTCDSKIIHCSALDLQKNRLITQAYLTAHKVYVLGLFKTTVGIGEIRTE